MSSPAKKALWVSLSWWPSYPIPATDLTSQHLTATFQTQLLRRGRLSNPTPQKQLLLPPNCSPRLSWPPEHRYRSLTSQACAALKCIHYWLDSIPSHKLKVESLPLCSTNNKNHNTKLFRVFSDLSGDSGRLSQFPVSAPCNPPFLKPLHRWSFWLWDPGLQIFVKPSS